jgi:hypothetical protein
MDFSEVWRTWLRVTTRPSEATFAAERQKPNATLSTALIWMLIAGAVTAAVGMLQAALADSAAPRMLTLLLERVNLPQTGRVVLQMLIGVGSVTGLNDANIFSIITVPLGFLFVLTLFHGIAKLLGGKGRYGRYAYLTAAFTAPLDMLSALISIIPYINYLDIVIVIYQLVLVYFATKVEHQLTRGRTLLVLLLPVILLVALVLCIGIFVGGAAILQNAQ